MLRLSVFCSLILFFSFLSAYGSVDNFTTDKSLYHLDDELNISGNVLYDSNVPFVTIQIFTPGKSNFADVDTIPVNSDGSFSTTFHVGGPTWPSDGNYVIKVTYAGNLERSIDYIKSPETISDDVSETISDNLSDVIILKSKIKNFPSLDKSPQHYIDRYNDEPDYKSWFDSQFPHSSIYTILGYELPTRVPDWIQNNAEWWAGGEITDSTFLTSIKFMIENDIILISHTSSEHLSSDEIPDWIRNTSLWWSQNLISEDEFLNSLKFLIQEGIIIID